MTCQRHCIELCLLACRYELLMQAFGGEGYTVNSRQQLAVACRQAFAAKRPALINIAIDPMAGVESGATRARIAYILCFYVSCHDLSENHCCRWDISPRLLACASGNTLLHLNV